MKKLKVILALVFSGCLSAEPVVAQQARQMARSTTAFGDSSLLVTSDTLTSKTTFVTKAVSLAQLRKSLAKFSFDSVKAPLFSAATSIGINAVPGSYYTGASRFVTSGTGDQGISIIAGGTNRAMIAFGSGTGTTDGSNSNLGKIWYNNSTSSLNFTVNGALVSSTIPLRITSTGVTTGALAVTAGLDLSLATVSGLTAASVGTGTFPSGAYVFGGGLSGITTLAGTGAVSGFTTANFSGLVTAANGLTVTGAVANVTSNLGIKLGAVDVGIFSTGANLIFMGNYSVGSAGLTVNGSTGVVTASDGLTVAAGTTAVQALTATATTLTHTATPLLANFTGIVSTNTIIALQRGSSYVMRLGANASDQATIWNNAGTTSNLTWTDAGAFTFRAGISATTGTLTALPAEGSTQSAVCITSGGVLQQNAAASCLVSARRFKHAISALPLSDALNITAKLRAVAYEENGSNQKRIGLIAEEADSVDQRLASRNAAGLITSVNYEEVTIALLRTVQEQSKQIADLQARVAKLEKKP